MGVPVLDEDGVTSLHVADMLQINLARAGENVEEMEIEVFFKVWTVLPNGRTVGEPYFDYAKPLRFTCKNNPDLKIAMLLIQQTIGEKRYEQLTAAPEIPALPENAEIIIPFAENAINSNAIPLKLQQEETQNETENNI